MAFDNSATGAFANEQGTQRIEHARGLDEQDPLRRFRDAFIIPSVADLKAMKLFEDSPAEEHDKTPCTYLCGNSLGLQPIRTSAYIQRYLRTWATKGVYGHFKSLSDAATSPWVNIDEQAAEAMAPLIGARSSEVAIMQTLTANLHFLMASFYQPTKERWKIIIEGKAFPSDHYAVHSQLRHHHLDPATALILIEPDDTETQCMSTAHITSVIEQHAAETALILLPGIHFYTGQLLDIATITAFAHSKGIPIGWDLAHAAGNVPLALHDWAVDFAAWCSYKYLNGGPGAIAGLFVHERHDSTAPSPNAGLPSTADSATGPEDSPATRAHDAKLGYRHRLSGWWGSSKATRFAMDNVFAPMPGAAGWQLSNPSALDTTAVLASLSLFAEAGGMGPLRQKSLKLTQYLEDLLLSWPVERIGSGKRPYRLLTPRDPEARGAQISVRLEEGLLEGAMAGLEREGVVVDERRPDVVRIAPAPLYNSFEDVWRFADVFARALEEAAAKRDLSERFGGGTMVEVPAREKGWSEVT